MLDGIPSKLEHYMDLLAARQKLVVSNIANADTPGYKTRDIDFHGEFLSAIGGGEPSAVEVEGLKVKNDGNNVSVEREARLLAENDLRFTVASALLRTELGTIRSAIKEGSNS